MSASTIAPHAGAGRHTLGSSYDPPAEADPALADFENVGPASELPAAPTIYTPVWLLARERLAGVEPEPRGLLTALMDHVEAAWPTVRELQHLYARNRTRAETHDALGYVLSFIDSDLVDLFRGVAADAARLVPRPGARLGTADPGDLDGEAECFSRYMALLAMAVHDPGVPAGVRETVRRAGRDMEGWHAALLVLLRRYDEEVERLPPDAFEDEADAEFPIELLDA